jgi:flagellar hook-associated protein 3 FlgL
MVPTSEGILQPINLTAREIYFKTENDPDSIDIFDLLFSLKRALEDNDRRVLEQRLGDLDDAFEQVLNKRADMGAVRLKLEEQLEKVGDREFNNLKQLSELEDLDFPSAVVEMNMADVRNKASLNTSARLLQPSLLQFLR